MTRFRLFGLCALVFVFSSSAFSFVKAGEILTLNQALRIAVTQSPLVEGGRHEVEAFKWGEKIASGQRFPQIGLHASAERWSDPQLLVPMSSPGGTPVFSRDQYGAGVNLRLPLYEGGRLVRQVTIAKLSAEVSRSRLRLATQDVIANATNAFNAGLYLKELVVAQDETLSALRKTEEDATVKLNVGRIAPVDLMRIQTQVAEQEQALIRSREEERRSRQTLALLLGLDPSREPELAGTLTPPEPIDVETAQVKAQGIAEKRPDVRAAMREVEKAEAEVKRAWGLHLPSVGAVADYSSRAGSHFDDSEDIWFAGVSVNLNLFSGGTIAAGVNQAKARLLSDREHLRQTKLNAQTEIVHAISHLREARNRLDVAASARATAEESFRIEDIRYGKGSGTVTDSLLAQAAWLRARASELGAMLAVQEAVVEYRLAAGTIDCEFADVASVGLETADGPERVEE